MGCGYSKLTKLYHAYHHGWTIDALNSARIKPWILSWLGHGFSELRTLLNPRPKPLTPKNPNPKS